MKQAIVIFCILLTAVAYAQHPATHDTMPAHHSMPSDTMPMQHMSSAYSLSLPMNRNGSGTGWQPDNTPVYAAMYMARRWYFMLQGSIYARYTAQNFNNPGKRGDNQFDAPNWAMLMVQRQIQRNGLLTINTMFSLERLTMGGSGYPLLFQTGETYNRQPLVDRQHPHDLFMGLGIGYTQRITNDMDVSAAIGYPGEPALGPTAFMHRISAWNNPDAPLGHHWQDATHITFGVGTLGFRYKIAKVEGSIFTGREPDENRYNFDKPTFDSYAYRVSVNPVKSVSVQFSQGFIKSPEVLEPEENIIRTTASVQHVFLFSPGSYIASSVIYGLNSKYEDDIKDRINLSSILVESDVTIKRVGIYGRFESIKKLFNDLALPGGTNNLSFTLNSITLGSCVRIFSIGGMDYKVGGQCTTTFFPNGLSSSYGATAISGQVYIRMTPTLFAGR